MIRHFVTDRARFGLTPDGLVERAALAARRGAAIIQVRERGLDDGVLLDLVRRVIEAVRAAGTRVLVNDRSDVAMAAGAAGVHLRGDSPSAARVRTIVPPGFIIGRSVHALDERSTPRSPAAAATSDVRARCCRAGKPGGKPVAGFDALARACARSPLPVIAIGGMTPAREPDVARAGAAGLAAVGWFM